MTDAELMGLLQQMRGTMVSVSTGGPRIGEVNHKFQQDYEDLTGELTARGIENPLPYDDLWQWHGRWSSGDLPSYASRRVFVAEIFDPIIKAIRNPSGPIAAPTGWARVDRTIGEARTRLAGAKTEEQFQAVGLLCREALISLAQGVFDPKRHPVEDVKVSATDFKRMIEAYISVELKGSSAEEARRHARSALDLALRLQHQRTAAFRDAAICLEATGSVVNIIAILSGKRDPAET